MTITKRDSTTLSADERLAILGDLTEALFDTLGSESAYTIVARKHNVQEGTVRLLWFRAQEAL